MSILWGGGSSDYLGGPIMGFVDFPLFPLFLRSESPFDLSLSMVVVVVVVVVVMVGGCSRFFVDV